MAGGGVWLNMPAPLEGPPSLSLIFTQQENPQVKLVCNPVFTFTMFDFLIEAIWFIFGFSDCPVATFCTVRGNYNSSISKQSWNKLGLQCQHGVGLVLGWGWGWVRVYMAILWKNQTLAIMRADEWVTMIHNNSTLWPYLASLDF